MSKGDSLEVVLARVLEPIVRAAVRAELDARAAAAAPVLVPSTDLSDLPPLLRRADACKLLGCSVRTLERLEAVGRIRVVRLGSRTPRVPRGEILRLLAEGQRK